MRGALYLLALIVNLMLLPVAGHAALEAQVDRQQVLLGDTLRLTLRGDGDSDPETVDLAPLLVDFQLMQRARSSSTRIVNGVIERSLELVITLAPKRIGELTIPALQGDRSRTQPITISVSEMPADADAAQGVYLEVETDREWAYVQAQVVLKIRIMQAQALDERRLSDLEIPGAVVHFLDQSSFQRRINSTVYQVAELRYALFAEQSGTLTIPEVVFTAREAQPRRSVFDYGGGGRLLRRQSAPITLEIKPKPGAYPVGSPWLPAQHVELEEIFSADPDNLSVGESITRTLTLRGDGVQSVQLPGFPVTRADGLRSYPNPEVSDDTEQADGLKALRSRSEALLATRPGVLELPELRVVWWDTESDSLREANLPARQIEVLGVVADATDDADTLEMLRPESSSTGLSAELAARDTRLWQGATGVALFLWLLTLLLWWRSARTREPAIAPTPSTPPPQIDQAVATLQRACRAHDARQTYRALLGLASALGLATPTLASLRDHCKSAEFDQACRDLERSLYMDEAQSWDAAALQSAAERAIKTQAQCERLQNGGLRALYPA